jgi:hypothetical protein
LTSLPLVSPGPETGIGRSQLPREAVCAWPPFGASKPDLPLMCTSEVRLISTYVTRHASHKNKMMFIAVIAKQKFENFLFASANASNIAQF